MALFSTPLSLLTIWTITILQIVRIQSSGEIVVKCLDECNSTLGVEKKDDFAIGCDEECKMAECSKGCYMWQNSLETNCRDSCLKDRDQAPHNSSFPVVPVQELYCVMGCHFGGSAFVQRVKEEAGKVSGPMLVAESRTNTSVRIRWTVPKMPFNASFFLQWKYESSQGSWEFLRPQREPCARNDCRIQGLQPYTKYKFRVGWLVVASEECIYSEESVAISTLAYGAPSTAPTITGLSAVDSSKVSVSWDPPVFPNGPVVSYVVYLTQDASAFVQIKDVQERFYMFANLAPETNYTVSVSCRNGAGEGPRASRRVATAAAPRPAPSDASDKYLVLGAHRDVIMQEWRTFEEPRVLYRTASDAVTIVDVAVHVGKRLVFFCDSRGAVAGFPVDDGFGAGVAAPFSNSTRNATALSVDWLNDRLYLAEGNSILRADLDGGDLRAVVEDLDGTPSDLHADPFNGFLFWAVAGRGVYRADLGALDGGVSSSRRAAKMVVKDARLAAFAVDHRNFRLLVPSGERNTVYSSSLDGVETEDVRRNIQKPRFQNVKSLAVSDGLFYWTDGEEVLREEYHSAVDKYFHNTLIDLSAEKRFVGLSVFHADAQPFPVPVNAVGELQALFLSDAAKVSWSPPKLIGGSGVGAWQAWTYELVLTWDRSPGIRAETTRLARSVANLTRDSDYEIRVRAGSPAGKGPWSEPFRGRTLRHGALDGGAPYLLWSGKDGLARSDLAAESFRPFDRHASPQRGRVTGASWYEDLLFLNTNENLVFALNVSGSSAPTPLQDARPAVSVAVDWLAKKLYWSNPRQQMISRANLNGSRQEPLPILTVARELNVDAMGAGLYWTTAHTVEHCRLNGADRQVYFQADFFSGTQVTGLTLDLDSRVLYWTVRSFGGCGLYRADMMNPTAEEEEEGPFAASSPTSSAQRIAVFPANAEKGPLRYFSHRLYWLLDGKQAMVSDVWGRNFARLGASAPANVSALAVVDPSLQPTTTPSGPLGPLEVVPDQVDYESLRVEGKHDDFSVVWDRTLNVNFGKVFYEVTVEDGVSNTANITEDNRAVYAKATDPYSLLNVSVRAFTYWGSSRPTVKSLRTPMSVPSAPLRPRVFVTHGAGSLSRQPVRVGAEFRWSPPKDPNGVVLGYVARYWTREGVATEKTVAAGERPALYVDGLLPNGTYFFQVAAYTREGRGPPSEAVEARTDEERPVPRLLLTRGDAVKVADVDSRREDVVATDSAIPLDVAFLGRENAVYWLDRDSSLMRSALDGSNKTRLHALSGPGNSLTVDWVGRHLYWTQTDAQKERRGTIWDMDLDSGDDPKVVVRRRTAIGSVEVVPLTRSLIWTDVDESGVGHLMTAATDGSRARPFFGSSRRRRSSSRPCDCPGDATVRGALAVDQSQAPEPPTVLWVNADTGHIWTSDVRGCRCRLAVNTSAPHANGIPPTSLTADRGHVYWSNSSLGQVFGFPKTGGSLVQSLASGEAQGVTSIAAIGAYLQPYPDAECLAPRTYGRAPRAVDVTSSSARLVLAPADASPRCEDVSAASVAYAVRYATGSRLRQLVTYNLSVLLENLSPYARYEVSVGASNYYSADAPVFGPSLVFETLEGVPSAPRNVRAAAVTPERLRVTWDPPEAIRGPSVRYFVTWGRRVSIDERQTATIAQTEVPNGLSVDLEDNIEPDATYFVTVRAYTSSGGDFNESEEAEARTCPRPDDVTVTGSSANSLSLSWRSPSGPCAVRAHSFLYKRLFAPGQEWTLAGQENSTSPNATYDFDAEGLVPGTRYAFRAEARYAGSEEYRWPEDESLAFETEGDRPGDPGAPAVLNVGRDAYRVRWDPSSENGGKFISYVLQAKAGEAEGDRGWTTVYNGSEPGWAVSGLDPNGQYRFRVWAYNDYGPGNFSFSGADANLVGAALFGGNESWLGVALGVSLSLVVLVGAATAFAFLRVCKRRERDEKKMEEVLDDLELATLRDLPRHANFVHQDNALYTVGDVPTDEELAALPRILREQITLSKFLGSGAFGEVFEGVARDLPAGGDAQGSRVAIKTLRKGATDQEKGEFLKEAQLMSNFKHGHILSLLGICLDNDPNFIILELMEGGDLLSYLRASRSTAMRAPSLAVQDLIGICVDVAKGCRYLEDMHFVHRDLAARNCLVSSRDPASRVVKIGDFGLARDVYKNDYYRKEGEGLLPVRWMSPESLVDGVFTSQSDVWAFGVLLWEVMTFGQQPYPARTNLEVLHYVKSGGRLENPQNCPDDLHQLMHECWSYDPSDRPTFKYCYRQLQELRRKSAEVAVPCVHNDNYFGRPNAACAQRNEDDDELRLLPQGVPACGFSSPRARSPTAPATGNGDLRVLLDPDSPLETPKYLELIYDTDGADYENPIRTNWRKSVGPKRSSSLGADVSRGPCDERGTRQPQRRTVCLPAGGVDRTDWERRSLSECSRSDFSVDSGLSALSALSAISSVSWNSGRGDGQGSRWC